MLGLFVTGISPYISLFKRTALRSLVKRGAEGRILHIGKADVYYADLSLPLSVPDSGYQRFLDSTFRAAYERGVRQAVMPACTCGNKPYRRRQGLFCQNICQDAMPRGRRLPV